MHAALRPLRTLRHFALAGVLLLLTACSGFSPQPLESWPDPRAIQQRSAQGVTVSAGILGDAEAARLYGVDLADVGLQAIWLRIENRSALDYWLLVSALDPNYFSPDEAAVMVRPRLLGAGDPEITRHFRALAMPLKTDAGEVNEGYVLAPRHEGGRYFPIRLAGRRSALEFGFAVPLPDGDFDFEQIQPERIYEEQRYADLDLVQLREALRRLPCCTSDAAGTAEGDPLNLVLIGEPDEVLASLARGGWSFTHRIRFGTARRVIGAALSGAPYPVAPVSPLYLFGRAQDLAMQMARNTILQRNHLRLWLAPFRLQGRSVWVGQVSRDISIKPTLLSATFTTHVVDPNIDEAREHLLQSLLVAGAVQQFGFVAGGPAATQDMPRFNLTKDPYFSDGLRLVALLGGTESTRLDEVEFLDWRRSQDPLQRP